MNGNLALSRAIGDFEFKKSAELAPEQQIVTAYPDVVVHDMGDDDEFLVIACDGKVYLRRQVTQAPSSSNRLCDYPCPKPGGYVSNVYVPEQVSGIANPHKQSLSLSGEELQPSKLWRRFAKT